MINPPKISIVVPMYNVEKYIGDCLESILAQTYTDYEIIVVDDGSMDDSARIAEALLASPKLVCSMNVHSGHSIGLTPFTPKGKDLNTEEDFPSLQEGARGRLIRQANAGLSAARNAGLKAANGEYVLFLDSDDWLEKDALERLAKHIHGEDMICFSGRKWYQDTQMYEVADELQPATYTTGWEYYNENALQSRKFPFVCAVLRLYRRKFLMEKKLYFTEGIYHEDNMFTPYVCLYAQATKVINESIYVYRIRKGSITAQPKLKNIQDKLWIANEQARFFLQQSGISKIVVCRAITHLYHNVFDHSRYLADQDRQVLLNEIDWRSYYGATRTKLRHKIYYIAMHISPKVYYWVRKIV